MCEENKTPGTGELPVTDAADLFSEAAGAAADLSAGAADAAADLSAGAADAAASPADAPAGDAGTDDLETLRDTFQTVYDETRAEAEKAADAADVPEIQALDDPAGAAEEEDEDADEPEEPGRETNEKKPKKPKKTTNHKKKSVVLAVVLTLVCLLIVLPLVVIVVLFIRVPNLTNFFSASFNGYNATDPAEQISYFTEALGYCEDNEFLSRVDTQEMRERIALATLQKDGYSAAMSYVDANLTEEQRADPKVKEFKSLLTVADSVEQISAGAEAAVAEALGDGTDADALDYKAIAKSLGTPDVITDEIAGILRQLGAALVLEKTAETKEDRQTVITEFLDVYASFTSLGAKGQALLESIAVRLYQGGYAYETQLLLKNYFTEEMLAAPLTEEITAISDDLAAIAECGVDVYDVAEKQTQAGKTQLEDFKAAIDAILSDPALTALAQIAQTVSEAMQAEQEKNLTKAVQYYSTALASEQALGLPTARTAAKTVTVYFEKGDTNSANSVVTEFFPDGASEETDAAFADTLSELKVIYAAQNAANEIFSSAYYEMAYYGAEMNKEELNASLDALLTEDAAPYTSAYVSFYKYLTEAFTDQDYAVMQAHLDAFAKEMAAYPMMYAHSEMQLYKTRELYGQAITLAKTVLEIDVADDFANGMLALEARYNGDAQTALEIAEKGMELSGERNECAYQAAVANLLLGNHQKAYELAEELYTNELSVDTCELLKIVAVTYEGDDAELAQKLEEASAEIDSVFEQYQVTYSEDTQAVINGEKTLADVFLGEVYAAR